MESERYHGRLNWFQQASRSSLNPPEAWETIFRTGLVTTTQEKTLVVLIHPFKGPYEGRILFTVYSIQRKITSGRCTGRHLAAFGTTERLAGRFCWDVYFWQLTVMTDNGMTWDVDKNSVLFILFYFKGRLVFLIQGRLILLWFFLFFIWRITG